MKIRIDRTEFDVFEALYAPKGFKELPPTPTATGAELVALSGPGFNPVCQIVRIRYPDPNDGTRDPAIGWNEATPLADGMHFVSVPSATY